MTLEEIKTKSKAATAKVEAKVEAAEEKKKKPLPQARRMKAGNKPRKVLGFGWLGSGKTSLILGPLECGERILVASADFGGDGLVSVENAMIAKDRADLYENNIMNVNLETYEHVIAFLEDPLPFCPDIVEFDPTVLFFDGYSTFQNDYLDEYTEDQGNTIDADKYRHWFEIKRGTLRSLRKFLAFTLPNGKSVHKMMTTLQAKPDINEMTQNKETGPLIQGGAKEFTGGGFDVVVNCYKTEDKDGKEEFFYRFGGDGSKYAVKNRGFNLQGVTPADPVHLWKVLTGVA